MLCIYSFNVLSCFLSIIVNLCIGDIYVTKQSGPLKKMSTSRQYLYSIVIRRLKKLPSVALSVWGNSFNVFLL